ncbi:MAG: ribonuclease H-like domain-containing protein [Calditrichaeota bacterium]|nr:ribonuclease H-like domain-containing protein [Calditrichota bacterium]
MSIRDRLNRLAGDAATPEPQPVVADWVSDLQQELQMSVLQESRSFILMKETVCPLFDEPYYETLYSQGFRVPQLRKISADFPADLPDDQINLRNALFIDTETTGLAGGTGTYPFLIGIGHVELDHLVVRQYLLPDFVHEWLMLKHLDQALLASGFTVSFNGKSFDLPLLRSRYILNRMETVMDDCFHVDLLHAARRIWRRRLPACDLQSLEQHILGKTRIGDVPGEMVPHIYFEFIRKRDAYMIRDVLEHNYHDIANMMMLAMHMAAICEAPEMHLQYPQDQFSFAMYLMKNQSFAEAIRLLENLLSGSAKLAKDAYATAGFMLSLAFKKSGDSVRAKLQLEDLLEKQVLNPEVIETLAKFYEHEDKDFACASEITERGIQYLELIRQLDPKSAMLKFLPKLKHRHKRLQGKLGLK